MSLTTVVYSMPFSIDTTSTIPSDIKRHFTNSVQTNPETNQLEASFRGRPLNGKHVTIPSDYTGILTNSSKPIASFDQITYFNLDCSTSKNDCIARSLQWLSLAKILHE